METTTAASTTNPRREAINAAWNEYREQAARLSSTRRLGWTDYLEADHRAWQRYLAAERAAMALPVTA